MFEINATYLVHDGGTKFYEAIAIKGKRGPAMLIKRWGKIADGNTGGGTTKVERGTFREMWDEYAKIINEKCRQRPGKGQYVKRPVGFGLHGLADPANVGRDTLIANLNHYSIPDVRKAIDAHFGLGEINDVDDIVTATGEDVVVEGEEPTPEPERGATWASW